MKVEIGSVSSGTLRPEDLIPVFADLLEELDTDKTYEDLVAEAREWVDSEDENESSDDIGIELVNELIDALNEFAPLYCYFGAHPDDPADFGFWIDTYAILEGRYDRKLVTVRNLPEHILYENDHGNMTLYRVELQEEWSVV